MASTVVKEFRSETRMFKNLTISDFGIIVGYSVFMTALFKSMVNSSLTYVFIGFNLLVSVLLVLRDRNNPGLRRYKIILILLTRDKRTYRAL